MISEVQVFEIGTALNILYFLSKRIEPVDSMTILRRDLSISYSWGFRCLKKLNEQGFITLERSGRNLRVDLTESGARMGIHLSILHDLVEKGGYRG